MSWLVDTCLSWGLGPKDKLESVTKRGCGIIFREGKWTKQESGVGVRGAVDCMATRPWNPLDIGLLCLDLSISDSLGSLGL